MRSSLEPYIARNPLTDRDLLPVLVPMGWWCGIPSDTSRNVGSCGGIQGLLEVRKQTRLTTPEPLMACCCRVRTTVSHCLYHSWERVATTIMSPITVGFGGVGLPSCFKRSKPLRSFRPCTRQLQTSYRSFAGPVFLLPTPKGLSSQFASIPQTSYYALGWSTRLNVSSCFVLLGATFDAAYETLKFARPDTTRL